MKVNIFGVTYRVLLALETEDARLANSMGFCDYENKIIVLNLNIANHGVNPKTAITNMLIKAFMYETCVYSDFPPEIFSGLINWFSLMFAEISEANEAVKTEILKLNEHIENTYN